MNKLEAFAYVYCLGPFEVSIMHVFISGRGVLPGPKYLPCMTIRGSLKITRPTYIGKAEDVTGNCGLLHVG